MISRLKILLLKLQREYLTVHVLVPIALGVVFLYIILPEREVHQPPGVLAPRAPIFSQPSIDKAFSYKEYNLTVLADYELTARVLNKEKYHWGREADIAPVDLLLGWKEMSNTSILNYFSFHLSGRWYSWHAKILPLPEDEITKDLDNNHLIPGSPSIERQLKNVRIGQIVHIQGFLVSLNGSDGYNWHSSTVIGSTGGPQSCKLIYVLKFDVHP